MESAMNLPEDLKYTKDHEWIKIDGTTGTVGITDHAQGELGDVVFVELPAAGKAVKQGESFGTIEAVKAVSDLYAPVTGSITEINAALNGTPELVNKEPYGAGWMVKIKLSNPDELKGLLDAKGYQELIGK
jgi:glycine cleavage system H protein